MTKEFSKHFFYYVTLFTMLILGFLLVYINSSNKTIQIAIIVLVSFLYILWGILHHLLNHNLNTKIMIEYILVGSFGLAIILILL